MKRGSERMTKKELFEEWDNSKEISSYVEIPFIESLEKQEKEK